jgi:hypothetical protein
MGTVSSTSGAISSLYGIDIYEQQRQMIQTTSEQRFNSFYTSRNWGKSALDDLLWYYSVFSPDKEAPTKQEFKVGDKALLRENAADIAILDNKSFQGHVGIVTEVDLNNDYQYKIEFALDGEDGDNWEWIKYEQLTKENEPMAVENNPLKALKELALDADTRLLRETGLENEDGTPTSNGIVELNRRAWLATRTAVADDLRKALAAEKTDKQTTAPTEE